MFRKQPSKPQNRIDSLIGVGTKIEGNVNFTGGLRVDGEIVGNVTAISDEPSTLVLSEKARIEGEISVSHLVVNGEISGPVHVAEFLELQSRSRVKGDVHYNSLEPWSKGTLCIVPVNRNQKRSSSSSRPASLPAKAGSYPA